MASILTTAGRHGAAFGHRNANLAQQHRVAAGGPAGPDNAKQRDPYVNLRFAVEIDHVTVAIFTECSALTIETETFEYQEGGVNGYTHKLPTRTKYGNITLKRGLDDSQELYQWYLLNASGKTLRRNLSVILYDSRGHGVRRWDLMGAFPCKWTGPDLRADTGAVAVETVEFAHSGLIPGDAPRSAAARASFANHR